MRASDSSSRWLASNACSAAMRRLTSRPAVDDVHAIASPRWEWCGRRSPPTGNGRPGAGRDRSRCRAGRMRAPRRSRRAARRGRRDGPGPSVEPSSSSGSQPSMLPGRRRHIQPLAVRAHRAAPCRANNRRAAGSAPRSRACATSGARWAMASATGKVITHPAPTNSCSSTIRSLLLRWSACIITSGPSPSEVAMLPISASRVTPTMTPGETVPECRPAAAGDRSGTAADRWTARTPPCSPPPAAACSRRNPNAPLPGPRSPMPPRRAKSVNVATSTIPTTCAGIPGQEGGQECVARRGRDHARGATGRRARRPRACCRWRFAPS